jgi:predicted GNAT family N-acyltransferase
MKMKKDDVVIECDSFTKNIWTRYGFEEVVEEAIEEVKKVVKTK